VYHPTGHLRAAHRATVAGALTSCGAGPLPQTVRGVYPHEVVLTRAFLDIVSMWLASAPFVQPDLAQLVPLIVILTVTSTLALVALNTTAVFARVPDTLRVQWLRSIGVPATGLSGSVPSLVLLTQPRR
jgi:hypothetical protein